MSSTHPPITARAQVIVASTRAAAGVYPDRSGPILVDGLSALGFSVDGPVVVADGAPLDAELRKAIADGYDLVITSGGTGVSPTDVTPELTAALIDKPVPGIAEALRAFAVNNGVPMGMISRGIAGFAGRTLIVNVAGSKGAAQTAVLVLKPVLAHVIGQFHGTDHT